MPTASKEESVISLSFVIQYESNRWQRSTLQQTPAFVFPRYLRMCGTANTGTGDLQTELKSAHAVTVY